MENQLDYIEFRDKEPSRAQTAFIILSGIFLGSLALTNVIAGKFFFINLGGREWQLSCGIIAYPITFLVTDLISEVFGLKKANLLVKAGFVMSLFATLIILIAGLLPTWSGSPVSEASFTNVFGLMPGIVLGSMIAYLTAQFIDVRLFEWLRNLTNGKYLWLRNNGSTVLSQLIDTSLVVIIALVIYPKLAGLDAVTWSEAFVIIIGQYLFKALIALLDTPFIYVGVHFLKKWIKG